MQSKFSANLKKRKCWMFVPKGGEDPPPFVTNTNTLSARSLHRRANDIEDEKQRNRVREKETVERNKEGQKEK
jgi:hypothetical protein